MRRLVAGLLLAMSIPAASAEEPVRLYAAGSLRSAMLDIAEAYARATGIKLTGTFGASGLAWRRARWRRWRSWRFPKPWRSAPITG